MIKSILLNNFFSYRNQTIELNPTNFMVGINGSGKSNLIKAFMLLKAALVEGGLQELIINRWGGFDAICYKGFELTYDDHFSVEFEFDNNALSDYGYKFREPVYYSMSVYKVASAQNYAIKEVLCTKVVTNYKYFWANYGKGFAREGERTNEQHTVRYTIDSMSDSMLSQLNDSDRYPQISAFRKAVSDIAIYSYFNTTETSPIRRPSAPSASTKLFPDGSNLPQLLNNININFKKAYKAIINSLNAVNPDMNGIDFHTLGTNLELLLDEKELNSSVHIAHVSDGTIRFLCLMAIVHNPKRGRFICIDEPEVGLHPDMVCEIMEALEETADKTQYLISTHSELVLNHTTVDNLLVCEKGADNATQVKTFRTDEYKEWAAAYSTGKLWREGDLGGNRY